MYTYMCIYIYIERERDRQRSIYRERGRTVKSIRTPDRHRVAMEANMDYARLPTGPNHYYW